MLSAINKLLGKRYFALSLKIISLLVFIVLVTTGLLAYSTDAEFLKQLRNTNFGNLIVWSYWWPAIIVGAVLFGRIWCMVCPVELLTSTAAKFGLKRKRPSWLKSGWAITLFYALILFGGIQGLAIHRNPYYMAWYLLTIVVAAIVVGLIYEKNTFCRYVCPVGFLLGIYSKIAPIGWRVKSKSLCESCKDKSCIGAKYRYNADVKSCGVDLYPAEIGDNSTCIMCTGCMKTCAKHQEKSPSAERPNPGLTRIGFAKDLLTSRAFSWAEMTFVLIVSGFVISEIWTEWKVTNQILNQISGFLLEPVSLTGGATGKILHGIIIFALLPIVIWAIPYLAAKVFGSSLKLKEYLLNYSLAFVPIMAAAHIVKSILKSVSRIPYFEHLFGDLTGVDIARKIVSGEITLAKLPDFSALLVTVSSLLVIVAGIWLSAKVISHLNVKFQSKSNVVLYSIPVLYGAIYLIMLLAWRV